MATIKNAWFQNPVKNRVKQYLSVYYKFVVWHSVRKLTKNSIKHYHLNWYGISPASAAFYGGKVEFNKNNILGSGIILFQVIHLFEGIFVPKMQYLHYYFIAFQENMQFYWKIFKFSLHWLYQNFMIANFDCRYFTRIIDFHNDGDGRVPLV